MIRCERRIKEKNMARTNGVERAQKTRSGVEGEHFSATVFSGIF